MSVTRVLRAIHIIQASRICACHMWMASLLSLITWRTGCAWSVKGPLWLNSHHECVVLCCVPLLCCLCIAVKRGAISGAELHYFVNVYFNVKMTQPAWSTVWCHNAVWPDLARFSTKNPMTMKSDICIFVCVACQLLQCICVHIYVWCGMTYC